MVKFIIVRHGHSMGNKCRRFTGQMDSPLNTVGIAQAECVAKYISENFNPDAIYSSDLSRAYNSVKPLADKLGLDIIKCKELREIDVGKWGGILAEDIQKLYPEKLQMYRTTPGLFRFDGGESHEELMERGKLAFESIARQNEGKTVVVGTHGELIRTLHALWNNIPLERLQDISIVPNGSVTVVTYDNGNVCQLVTGYTDHLTEVTYETVSSN